MNNPLISVVIPTSNSEKCLRLCLDSLKAQTYRNYELIIVDGFSKDSTVTLAKQYTDNVFLSKKGRSGARNVGFSKAKGVIFVTLDADMILEKGLMKEIASKIDLHIGLIIPEVGYGRSYLSRCKDLEKRCYLGDSIVEAARVFSREAFEEIGGYDENLVFAEDWDIHSRLKSKFKIDRTESRILHNTEDLTYISLFKKSYLYGRHVPEYLSKKHPQQKQWSDLRNFFFFRHFSKLRQEPGLAFGLLFIKNFEYILGLLGFLITKIEYCQRRAVGKRI